MDETRIEKLRLYMIELIDNITNTNTSNVNANMLDFKIGSYSLDRMPNARQVENWITGESIYQDTFSFRSRNAYSPDTIVNLTNIGFFEKLEKLINSNNKKGLLPDIENIESIECLNCGSLLSVDDNTAEFDIQIRIKYRGEE